VGDFVRFWSPDDDARQHPILAKLDAIQTDIRRLFIALKLERRELMADIDALNAAVAELGSDETAEEALGVSFQAAITGLQQQVAAGAPNLQPAIAALDALDAKIKADTAAGGTLLAGLTPSAAATPAAATPATAATPSATLPDVS